MNHTHLSLRAAAPLRVSQRYEFATVTMAIGMLGAVYLFCLFGAAGAGASGHTLGGAGAAGSLLIASIVAMRALAGNLDRQIAQALPSH